MIILSGSLPPLMRDIVKFYNENKSTNFEQLYPSLLPTLQNIGKMTPLKELISIKRLINNKSLSQEWIEHFKNQGVLNNQHILESSVLKKFFSEYSKNYVPTIENEKVFINNQNIEDFTNREVEILKVLVPQKEISKEMIIKICEKDDSNWEYSPANIDQILSRIRKKLLKHGVSKNYIQTQKNKGYIITQ